MRVNAGYDAANFILNLSRKPTPMTASLDWGEIHNWDRRYWEEEATPYEHLEALFSSPACPSDVILRNPNLTDEQIKKLAVLQPEACRGRPDFLLSLRVFRTSYGLAIVAPGDGYQRERGTSGS
jgi:hypothetical protein